MERRNVLCTATSHSNVFYKWVADVSLFYVFILRYLVDSLFKVLIVSVEKNS